MIASGHHFNLSCEAEGTPPPRISWFKDGSRITSISTEHARRTSVMSFMPVRPENQGRYWCEAKSTEGWTQSPSVFLKGIKKEKEICCTWVKPRPKQFQIFVKRSNLEQCCNARPVQCKDNPGILLNCSVNNFPALIRHLSGDALIERGQCLSEKHDTEPGMDSNPGL